MNHLFKHRLEEKKVLLSRRDEIDVNIDISRNVYMLLNNLNKDKKIANLEDIAYINANYNKYRDNLQSHPRHWE